MCGCGGSGGSGGSSSNSTATSEGAAREGPISQQLGESLVRPSPTPFAGSALLVAPPWCCATAVAAEKRIGAV